MFLATLRLGEHVTDLYLHEIALHQNQGSADLQPPYTSDAISSPPASGAKKDAPVGPAHIGALGDCLKATHGILDTILGIELDTLLTLPVIFCKSSSLFPRHIANQSRRASYIRNRLFNENVGVSHKLR